MPPTIDLFAPGNNPFAEFLEEGEAGFRANLFARAAATGSQARERFFQRDVQNLFNIFTGRLGEQIRAGGPPNTTGEQFLNEIDLNRRFLSFAPASRGQGTAALAPATRTSFF